MKGLLARRLPDNREVVGSRRASMGECLEERLLHRLCVQKSGSHASSNRTGFLPMMSA